VDNSRKNFYDKKYLFNCIEKLVLVSPSQWLAGHLKKSFLSAYDIKVIPNGVNTLAFKPMYDKTILNKYRLKGKYILGVANV